jgi:hypothetical protein
MTTGTNMMGNQKCVCAKGPRAIEIKNSICDNIQNTKLVGRILMKHVTDLRKQKYKHC